MAAMGLRSGPVRDPLAKTISASGRGKPMITSCRSSRGTHCQVELSALPARTFMSGASTSRRRGREPDAAGAPAPRAIAPMAGRSWPRRLAAATRGGAGARGSWGAGAERHIFSRVSPARIGAIWSSGPRTHRVSSSRSLGSTERLVHLVDVAQRSRSPPPSRPSTGIRSVY
jgi:hypothetical protein